MIVRNPKLLQAFERIIERLEDSLDFMRVIGAEQNGSNSIQSVDLFTSHEVCHFIGSGIFSSTNQKILGIITGIRRGLDQRIANTSLGSTDRAKCSLQSICVGPFLVSSVGKVIQLRSSHFLWIGDRTRQLDGAHVE